MAKIKSNKIKAEILGIDPENARDKVIEALWTVSLRRRPNLKIAYEQKTKSKKTQKS